MARIRTVKPEFWTSEQIAECSPTARLLFIGIWSFSDDHGIHPASVKRLKMEVFPSDAISDDDIQAMVDELEAAELLHSYQVAGKDYWQVTGWARHQKIDKPTYRHPQPGAPVGEPAPAVHAPSPDVNSASAPREVEEDSARPRVRSLKESKGSKALSGSPDCLAILSHLNERAGRNYSPVRASLDLIGARLKEGATVAQCCAVVDAKVTEWATDSTMQKYLRPETLFNATKFAGYAGQLADADTCVKDWE